MTVENIGGPDMFGQAREDEERGRGIPFTDEEREQRHYERYGTTELPSRGTGLQSIGLLQSLGTPGTTVSGYDIAGLLGGGAVGWYIAKKFPNMVVKYVGVVVGAELGILIARLIRGK